MDREIDGRERRRRTLRRVAGALATGAVLATGLALATDWLRPSIDRSRTRFGTVERGDLEATIGASGTVVPASERVVSCPVDARVDRVLVRPGKRVERGTQILELDTSATRLELDRLEERLASNGNDRLQRRLELDEAISRLDSRIDSQRLDLEIAEFRLDQQQQLWDDGLIPEQALLEARVAVRKARIELDQSVAALATQRRLHQARRERLEMEAGILQKERDDARRRLTLAATGAPVAGVLTTVFEDEGATVQRGAVLARIADLRTFRVEARLSDAYASRLVVGQDAYVLIDGQRLDARLTEILPTIENGTLGFIVDVGDPSHELLRHNLRVDVLVVTGRRRDVLKAPRGPYIRGGGDLHDVFRVAGDHAERTRVTLGLAGHEWVEIVDGLEEGDRIVLSDARDWLHASRLRLN